MARRRKKTPPTPEIRSIQTSYAGEYSGAFTLPTLSGPTVNEHTALGITAVWNAVNIYANTIASLDLYVAERDSRRGSHPAYDHPVYDLVHCRPNQIVTSFRFRQRAVADYLTHGNHYSEIEFRGKTPVALHPLHPQNVTPVLLDDGSLVYHLVRENKDIPSWKVLHIAGLAHHDGIKGYSPIRLASEALGIAIAQEQWQASLMGSSAMPAGYIKTPQNLKDDQQSRLRDSWNKVHQGSERAGNVAILSGGIEWVQTSFSPQDAELLLSRNWSVSEVARLFNLPQHMLGNLDHASLNNIEELNLQFYQLSLRPHLENIEQEMNRKFFSVQEQSTFFVRHDERSLLRGNMSATAAYHTAMFNIGVLSPNEIRLETGLNPIDNENADKHFIPVNNLAPLEDIREPMADVEPVTPVEDDPSPVGPPDEVKDAIRDLVVHEVGRLVRRECQAVRKASRREGFLEWLEGFYGDHRRLVAESIAPSLRAYAALSGASYDPGAIATTLADESREQIRGLVVCVPPGELPDAVDRVCAEWEATRAEKALERT